MRRLLSSVVHRLTVFVFERPRLYSYAVVRYSNSCCSREILIGPSCCRQMTTLAGKVCRRCVAPAVANVTRCCLSSKSTQLALFGNKSSAALRTEHTAVCRQWTQVHSGDMTESEDATTSLLIAREYIGVARGCSGCTCTPRAVKKFFRA